MGVRYIFGQDGAFRTEPVIVAKNITENGTYDPATEGADGYAPVVVNVEGGGGSSDFSTAEVTLNLTVENATLVETSLETLLINYPNEDFSYVCGHNPSIDNKCSVLLYQGYATAEGVLAIDNNEHDYSSIVGTPVTTGGVSWDADRRFFEITGDGTITATLSLE